MGASAADEKRQEERRIKELRDFQRSTPANRHCFDCNEMVRAIPVRLPLDHMLTPFLVDAAIRLPRLQHVRVHGLQWNPVRCALLVG